METKNIESDEIQDQEEIEKLIMMAQMFTGFSRVDDYKVPGTAYYGGFQIKDMELQARIKAAGYEIMKSVGKKILSGDLNITSVSFPIKCMCPTSLLKKVQGVNKVLPFYLNYAASLDDPLERMRAVIAASMAWLWKNHDFDKPLNPVLGETYQARMADGGMLYAEQTCHHPPRTHTYVEGPQGNYTVHGYNEYHIKPYVNSLVVTPQGGKTVVFKDGQTISWNHTSDTFYNLLMGSFYIWVHGKVEFHDLKNDIYAWYEIGKVPGKTQEYFSGELIHKGNKINEITGNYCGYLDFDEKRYFDVREVDAVFHEIIDEPKSLPSDCMKRQDSLLLRQNLIQEAQTAKEEIEQLQRKDRASRAEAVKRREEGGPKHETSFALTHIDSD